MALRDATQAQVVAHARRSARRARAYRPDGSDRSDGVLRPDPVPDEALRAWAVANPAASRVVTHLALRGPASLEDIAAALGVGTATTARVLERLLFEDRVVLVDAERRVFRATAGS